MNIETLPVWMIGSAVATCLAMITLILQTIHSVHRQYKTAQRPATAPIPQACLPQARWVVSGL